MVSKAVKEIANTINEKYRDYEKILKKFNKKSEKDIIECPQDWNLYSLTTRKQTAAMDQKIMFIMQNPGEGKNKTERKRVDDQRRRVEEWQKRPESDEKLEDAIELMQEHLRYWLEEKNEHFLEFFEILSKEGIIEDQINKDKVKDYIRTKFLDDFYVTDLFKYRVSTGKLGKALDDKNKEKQEFEEDLMRTLEYEIEQVSPSFIFLFSTRSWETFYTYFEKKNMINIVGEKPKELKEKTVGEREDFLKKVTNVHGLTFELSQLNGKKACVIPLCHFSPRYYNILIRGSYFRYFRERIKSNKEIISKFKMIKARANGKTT